MRKDRRKVLSGLLCLCSLFAGARAETKTAELPPGVAIVSSDEDVFYLGGVLFQLDSKNVNGVKAALTSIYETEIGKRVFASLESKKICLKDQLMPEDTLFCVQCPTKEDGYTAPEELLKNLVLCAQKYKGRVPTTSGDEFLNNVVALVASIAYKDEVGICEDEPVLNYFKYLKKENTKKYKKMTYGRESAAIQRSYEDLVQAFLAEKIVPDFPEEKKLLDIIHVSKLELNENTISDDCRYVNTKILGIPRSNLKIIANAVGKQHTVIISSLQH